MSKGQTRLTLAALVAKTWDSWDPAAVQTAITDGQILVDGRLLTNPNARVTPGAHLRFEPPHDLAGRRKLSWGIERFGIAATGRVALDVGASTGGFTTAWLEAGATRVYAVDAGHGQLLGSLRQDSRVVNLERTNVGQLSATLVPEPVSLVSVDVSYLSLAAAVRQLEEGVSWCDDADLLGLVKPMFELRLATIPDDAPTLERARDEAVNGVRSAQWHVMAVEESPIRGGKGAVEFLLHAKRSMRGAKRAQQFR
jgi:23S rRNA (cytidine1920-2'-O)/16S rRNA (cytidine1409-2'-O)-methyltransferase